MSKLLPLAAIVAQQKIRQDNELKAFYLDLLEQVSSLTGQARVDFCRSEIDKYIKLENESNFSCRKGCSHCCYHLISLSSNEVGDLPKLNSEQNEIINFQIQYLDYETQWNIVPTEFRRCVFLDDNNSCSVYEKRPLVCRSTLVSSPSENCKLEGTNEIEPIYNTKANLVMLAFYTVEDAKPFAYALKEVN